MKTCFILLATASVAFSQAVPNLHGGLVARKRFDAITAPVIDDATINGNQLVLTFSKPVSTGAGWNTTDLDLDMSTTGSNIAVTSLDSGSGTDTWTFTMASAAVSGETVDLDFNGDANSIEDTYGNDLAAIVSQSVTNATPALPPASEVYGWWAMEDAGGGNWLDETTNNLDLTETSTPTSTTGKVSNGVNIDEGDGLSLASGTFGTTLHQSDFTAGGWVNPDNIGSTRGYISQWTGTNSTRLWSLQQNAGLFRAKIRTDATFDADANSAYSSGTWYHIVIRRSGTELALFVNGVKQTDTETISGTEQSASTDLTFGVTTGLTDGDHQADEFFFAQTAWSDSEILGLYNSGAGVTYSDLP